MEIPQATPANGQTKDYSGSSLGSNGPTQDSPCRGMSWSVRTKGRAAGPGRSSAWSHGKSTTGDWGRSRHGKDPGKRPENKRYNMPLVLQPHISRLSNFDLAHWANSLQEGMLPVAGSFSNQSWSMPPETNCGCSTKLGECLGLLAPALVQQPR